MQKVVERICTALALVAGGLLTVVAVIMTVDALGRKFLSLPLPGTVDIVGYGIALIVALSLPLCSLRGGHVFVPFVTDGLRGVAKHLVKGFAILVSVLFLGLLSWRMALIAQGKKIGQDEMWMLPIQTWPIWAIAAGLLVFTTLVHLMGLFWNRPEQPSEGNPQ